MNKEKLKGYWEKVRETFGKISKKVKILIAAALVVLLVLIVALGVFFPALCHPGHRGHRRRAEQRDHMAGRAGDHRL